MADIELVIKMPEDVFKRTVFYREFRDLNDSITTIKALEKAVLLPKGHGRIGDLDELEQRISNFVERDANITDEYTVARQRFIVDGIKETPTIIEADKVESEE